MGVQCFYCQIYWFKRGTNNEGRTTYQNRSKIKEINLSTLKLNNVTTQLNSINAYVLSNLVLEFLLVKTDNPNTNFVTHIGEISDWLIKLKSINKNEIYLKIYMK